MVPPGAAPGNIAADPDGGSAFGPLSFEPLPLLSDAPGILSTLMSKVPLLTVSGPGSPPLPTGGIGGRSAWTAGTPACAVAVFGIDRAGWARIAAAAQAHSSAARPPTRPNCPSLNAKRTTALLSPL